ncbi:MAG: sorbosone dehydrogenase family protein, partial [Methylococcales bacterium]|nr:sorbosone dehydrogenase family protein [Methylococcales bacterium]
MKIIKVLGFFLLSVSNCFAVQNSYADILKQLKLPAGFSISIFAKNIPNARTLAISETGVVYVGTRQQGDVYAVKDNDGDGFAEKRYVIARNLYMPNGVAYKDMNLYVAETNRIIRFNHIEHHLDNPPEPVVIYDKLPSDKHHGWKYLRFGKDNRLYTAVGAPCNICLPEKDIYSSLVRLNKDGSGFEIIARGIRNTVGFDWQPG